MIITANILAKRMARPYGEYRYYGVDFIDG
jgi:hypothetical protein